MRLSFTFLLLLFGPADVTRDVYLMGTRCTLTSYAPPKKAASQLEKYIKILEQTEDELSVWREGTELSRINVHAVNSPLQLKPQLFALLEDVFAWARLTERTFDPAIGRVLQARGFYGKRVETAPADVTFGIDQFSLNSAEQSITRLSSAWLDSGAFGKGEGLDRVYRQSLLDRDEPWMIDFGGQIMVGGRPPGRKSWSVDIAHPQRRDEPALKIELVSGSISTSSVSEQPDHILDPRTGKTAGFKGSVTVWHARALVADILSTALFVMGPVEGLAWAERNGFDACFLTPATSRDVAVRATTGFRRRFML